MLNFDNKLITNEATIRSPNLTGKFSERDLQRIGYICKQNYLRDKASREKWEHRNEAGMNLAMQVVKSKNFPWEHCANIAFPLITMAALQFHSRAYPAIIQGPELVKYRTVGPDPDGEKFRRAERVGAHMSYQLLEEDESWEEQHDRLLINLPIVGTAFKKSYYSAAKGHNVSELVLAQDLVMDYHAKSVEECGRKTHKFPLFRNDIYEKVYAGVYRNILDEAWYTAGVSPQPDKHQLAQNNRAGIAPTQYDDDTPFIFLEQHCSFDFDEDGYKEPYIITIEEDTGTVVRIVSRCDRKEDIHKLANGRILRIVPTEYFTKYGFIPSPDGAIYEIGFGTLLGPNNEAVNSLINQLLDAGTMSNSAGGFLGRGAKVRGGVYTFAPMEWKRVDSTGDDLRKSIFPLPVREPSNVLFQLLTLLIEYTSRVAGTTETLTGESPGQNTPAQTTQTALEQGLKVYNAIFKRIWRSMKAEFQKLYVLNAIHLPTEGVYAPATNLATKEDYMGDPRLVRPVADPNITSDALRLQQAILLANRAATTSGYNPVEVEKRFLKANHVEGWETVYTGQPPQGGAPDPKIVVAQMKMQEAEQRLEFEKMKFVATLQEEMRVNQATILELTAKATLEMEQAGGVKTGHAIAMYEAAIGAAKTRNDHILGQLELMLKKEENDTAKAANGTGIQGVASESSD